ncbi:MAG: oxidoreductase [Pseudohongiellaceae bacterium]
MKYRTFEVSEAADKKFASNIVEKDTTDLPTGNLLIRVEYSCLNYKDALSASGSRAVTKNYPHTPGIDAAGEVVESDSPTFAPGTKVIVTGYDLGMNTPGGFGQYIRVPTDWAVACPQGLDSRHSMMLGTAGLTAALCIEKLLHEGLKPKDGPVLVTGASGGVGILAVGILAGLGFEVVAATGKDSAHTLLQQQGASKVINRSELAEDNPRPLLREQWAGAVDVVGGDILFNVIKSLRYGASVAACGLVQSPAFQASVFPFILRGVNLLGVDSVELPLTHKAAVWQKLATDWKLAKLDEVCKEITLDALQAALDTLLQGGATGRYLLNLQS